MATARDSIALSLSLDLVGRNGGKHDAHPPAMIQNNHFHYVGDGAVLISFPLVKFGLRECDNVL